MNHRAPALILSGSAVALLIFKAMTHYYLYIEAGHQIDENTRFYRVAIGESAQMLKRKAWLESYALEHGHFFVLWTLAAISFYDECRLSLEGRARSLEPRTAHGLIHQFKTGEDDPATYYANLNRHKMLMQIDPRYYSEHTIFRRNI